MTKEQIDFQDFTKIKILALTGKTAESYVRKNVPDNVTVKVLPVNIAAFITRNLIKKSITKKELQKYDLLLIPGLVQQDMTSLSEELGIPIIKGPRYASDIKLTLREISPFKLSSKYPADKYLKKIKQKELQTILTNGRTKPLEEHEFYIGTEYQLPVGLHRPPIIMAEIVDFTELSEEEIFSKADYFLRHGAEVLDLGAVAGNPKPDKIKEIIPDLRQKFSGEYNFLLSIDSLDSEEILVASQKNIDLVLSIDHSNIDAVIPRLAKDTGIVIVPTNVKEGTLPRTKEKRIQSLLELKKKLLAKGYEKLFADPILEMPINPGFSQSLNYYIHYR
ncbi:MAG: DUF6513 domain-containing protein, partial [Asgard group archaeon]|nr:DUF6513 domain-containing protein [Asgard group archaeon]